MRSLPCVGRGLAPRAGAALLFASLALPVLAEPPKDLPPAVQSLEARGLEIVNQFEAPGNLTGYAARAGSREVILYATADGEHVLAGTMMGVDGSNLTQQHMAEHMPERDLSAAWAKLEESNYVTAGAQDPKRVVYVFTDPNCPYCHSLWKATVPYYEEGLQVRYVPVAVLKQSSMGKAAAILQADDPAAAVRRHEQAFEQGGIDPVEDPQGAAGRQVRANTQLMQELGVQGTPAVFYKTEAGKVKSANGMPSLDRLARIYRLPKQDSGDPALSKFR